ncbi:hypothetical protein BGZ80_005723 [Entomortierella chlamydospora]|uniref:Protein kinase domain-containing protein n=1 Tax=Entomortierella chlamydospora TaxID=101097 RepID=A0A9P6MIT3_9FUNG|nr:hypothetical protein BGZ80_005723 [Entomortierella chlamydospora]
MAIVNPNPQTPSQSPVLVAVSDANIVYGTIGATDKGQGIAVLKETPFVINDISPRQLVPILDNSGVAILEFQISSTGVQGITLGQPSTTTSGTLVPTASEPPHSTDSTKSAPNHTTAIVIGSVVGALAVVAAIAAFLVVRKRKSRGGRSIFTRKTKDLFPVKADETMVPLGIYHQDRSLPEVPRYLESDLQRLGYSQGFVHSSIMAAGAAPYSSFHSRNSSNNNVDETIPIEAALKHHQHNMLTPQGLHHSVSVSSTTSNFARRNAKSGKRFEEKIQLQVIRYEIQDAHLISPHGTIGRLVLGTYHILSPPRSARSAKALSNASQTLARSGTVVVRKSRTDFGSGQSPSRDMVGDSSMLLTDAENQHTFETSTLKWYVTEIHWKREAALLKHLKSPIFVMELLESYCIPALQNRANTYPFVNAMGGCSSLLSDVGPIKTAQHARSILRSISAAVDWCHRHGVVHLNIQPGSFFLEDGIDPKAEDAPWKLWDFTCARFIGEPIGVVGGGGNTDSSQQGAPIEPSPLPPPNHLSPDAYPFLEQRQVEEIQDRVGGNPLPAAYTAPELLEAWRASDTTFPAEAVMDTWSLGCVYYEILTGQALFATEADAWGLVGGWDNKNQWTSQGFRVPYPPPVAGSPAVLPATAALTSSVQDNSAPYEKSRILDPSGSISKLLHDMMTVHADERISLETIMERIY